MTDKPMSSGLKLAMGGVFVVVWAGLVFLLNAVLPPFHKGGWGMWPILAVGMVFLLVTVDRVRYLFFVAPTDSRAFVAEIQKNLMQGNVQAAIGSCRANGAPIATIVEAGLSQLHRPDEEVQEAVDEAALFEMPRIEQRTGYLAMIGNIATLLGLLGTIVGLIKSFAGVSMGSGKDPNVQQRAKQYVHLVPACKATTGQTLVNCIKQNKAAILSQGISEAMNCTAFGLLVGILSLLSFSVLNGRTQHMLDDINEGAVHLVNLAVRHRQSMNLDFATQGGVPPG